MPRSTGETRERERERQSRGGERRKNRGRAKTWAQEKNNNHPLEKKRTRGWNGTGTKKNHSCTQIIFHYYDSWTTENKVTREPVLHRAHARKAASRGSLTTLTRLTTKYLHVAEEIAASQRNNKRTSEIGIRHYLPKKEVR